jgi:signal transduction histidine kinase
MHVERKLLISIISADRQLTGSIDSHIRELLPNARINVFSFEASFLESASDTGAEVIISDRTGNQHSDWSGFYREAKEALPDALMIFILPDGEKQVARKMLDSGIYEVIWSSSLNHLENLLYKIIRDIDDKMLLRYLSREKAFSDQIVNSSRSMLSIINRDYVYEKVNATFCDAHNLNVDSIVGKTLSEVWGEDTFSKRIKDNVDLCFSGNTIRYEANFDTPLFGNRYFEVVFRPISRGKGEITHLLAETFDITELKKTQKVVNEMEEEFKKLETNLPIGFLRCQTDGTILHANKALVKIIGCEDQSTFQGLNIKDFYAEKGLFDIHLRQLKSEQIKTFGRVPMYTCTGAEIACRISGFVVTDNEGDPAYIDFAFEDSTRELMLENRLLQAQKLETIGALAGGLAHDFNNILSTILGYSEMLFDELPKDKPSAEMVTKIISAVTKARSLTSQILTFSRQVEQQKIHVGINEVLREAIGFIDSVKPQNINIISNAFEPSATVYADPTQLFRVFLNLMTNGIQAMEKEGGTLLIDLTLVEGNTIRKELSRDIIADEYVMIRIEDTGVGMDPSVLQRIFEPYFTTKPVGKGTGLGLSVVHGIVAEVEGEILVTSRKGKGSVFSVYLPVSAALEASEKTDTGKNILFISGNLHESRILSLGLEKCGYELDFVKDRKRLSEKLADREYFPDMIIYMDDSADISSRNVADLYIKHNLGTPLILITDNDQYLSKEILLNSGVAKQVLLKPVSLREIDNAIQLSLV